MTASLATNARKSLADQINRLDGILDGLAEAIPETIAAAIQTAMQKAILDLMSNPEIQARLCQVGSGDCGKPSHQAQECEPRQATRRNDWRGQLQQWMPLLQSIGQQFSRRCTQRFRATIHAVSQQLVWAYRWRLPLMAGLGLGISTVLTIGLASPLVLALFGIGHVFVASLTLILLGKRT